MNKENIKIGLLGVIALTLVINTYFAAKGKKVYSTPTSTEETSKATSEMPVNGNTSTPTVAPATINTNPTPNAAANNGKATSVSFAKYEHDYGTVVQESANKTSFVFTNTGKEPLIISSATGSCGCTVPNYPKDPIMPGKTGKIDVEFKPSKGQTGVQEKTVTVTANTEPAQTILKIKANVN
jgi:hypothetical protein